MPILPHLHAKCSLLHTDLSRHTLAWPFLEPVDPVALNVPTYFDVISQPMDLRTMGAKLTAGEYNDPTEYRADLLLMFANAIEFNQDDQRADSVANIARQFQDVALAQWDQMFSEAATADWALMAQHQTQQRFIQRAKDARILQRWKRDSFVARFNRDKLDERTHNQFILLRLFKMPRWQSQSNSKAQRRNSIYDLTLDAAFEFDGGSGFGSTLPSNKPMKAIEGARAAMTSPLNVKKDARHAFSFTTAEVYTSPKKIPVFPGTLHSPEVKRQKPRVKPPRLSSTVKTGGESLSIPSGPSKLGGSGRSMREPSPRPFLRAMLSRSFGHEENKSTLNQQESRPFIVINRFDSASGGDDASAETTATLTTAILKTGEDAITFFARNGSHNEQKFVYLNRVQTKRTFRPYDLVVVAQDDVAPSEHFTMSKSGLVHICAGSPSEFIALAEWMRESTLFNLLTSLRFFKHYLVTKTFLLWCANIRFKLFCRQRKRLSAKLFLARESFCSPLLQVNKVLNTELMSVVLLDVRAQKTYESGAFVEYQGTIRAEGLKQFEVCIEKLQSIIQRVCSDVKKLTEPTPSEDNVMSEFSFKGMGVNQDKTKSIVAAKAEQQQRRKLARRAVEEAGMITNFIRLVDCITIASLVNLAVHSCATFLQELNKVPRKTGLFETTVFFRERLTLFAPTSEQIQLLVLAMTDDIVSTVSSVSRVLYLRPFAPYVGNVLADAFHLGSMITSNATFKQIRKELVDKVENDYAEASEYVKSFDSVRPIFEFDQGWDLEEYSQRAHTVSTLKADMQQISTWEKELEKMRAGQTVGILHVESRKLKQALIPMTTAKLDAMKSLVKDLARARCKSQLAEYKQRIQLLLQRPQHLKEFAGYVERVQSLKSKLKSLVKSTVVVDDMYRLLNTYGVRISSEDMVQFDDLRSIQENYKEETEAVDTFVASRIGEMTQQLDANIYRVNEQVLQLHHQLQGGLYIDASHVEDPSFVKSELEIVRQRLAQLDELSKQYTEYQLLFDLTPFEYSNLQATHEYFTNVDSLWTAVEKWKELYREAMTRSFVEINAENLSKDVAVAYKNAHELHKKLNNDATAVLKERTANFKLKLPTILDLGNLSMKDRHWEKLFKVLRQPWYPGLPFTLENLVAYDIFDMKELVGEISATASGEAQIEASLQKIKYGWEQMEFTCVNHRDQSDVFILGSLEDVLTLLEDDQVSLQTMMGSRYILGVKEEVERWSKRLSLLSETLDEWIACQRSWMYLETIFCADDIQKQLPVEAQKFALVDKNWRTRMLRIKHSPNVIKSVDAGSEYLDQFRASNKVLEEIQKSLEDYLETKRMTFPRFYFLSNDELLEILSQTRDPRAVQPHLGKCFDAMKSVQFDDTSGSARNLVQAMVSGEGELVLFSTPVKAKGPVESWLSDVEKAMRTSLYEDGVKALMNYPVEDAIDRQDWLFGYAAQMIILVDQVFWTRNVTEAIVQVENGTDIHAVDSFLQFSLKQIDGMVQLVRGSLTKLQRILMGAVITIDVHARDVVRSLAESKVASLSDFEWTRQLRYYWEDDVKNFVARQTNTRFIYGYEYLGNSPRLVITPLTDICYMTLTGALHLRLGGAPAGPAGTGKTETTKDLAKALAVQCVVFNCSDGLDFKIMGRFFSGLAQAGAWACFDEFNRIDIEVLSVIAQQVLCIQQAIVADLNEFEFEGSLIKLNTGFGVFITMNPGYAGRTELPDNLKALFRPVAMMVPDYRLIAEIVLFSEGFANALPLSHKMTQLYSLSSEQLSKQDHYDFGMRAVKSVLVAAGQLKRKEPDMQEELLLIRAMRDSNVPKFLEQDLPLFRGIIADLFPGVVVPFVDYGLLQESIEQQLDLLHLQRVPSFISKAIQVHETQLVRHGMMLVGEAGSGKSTNCDVLARALTQLYQDGVVDRDGYYKEVQRLILNPKSITAGQLYGEFNHLTNEWTDGLVPKLVRQCVQEAAESDRRNWVIFDGPVDAVWIENMNTVLDDNKTLCLSNSERIKLPQTLHMMFEVQDLRVASPATVSRCGMVYMEQVHVGMTSLARTWRATTLKLLLPKHPELCNLLLELIETNVPVAIAFVRENCHEKIPSNDHNLMQSCLNLLASCLDKGARFDANANNMAVLVRMYFVFAVTWSVGANIDDTSRPKFNDFCMRQFGSLIDSSQDGVQTRSVYEVVVDDTTGKWVSWADKTPAFTFVPDASYFTMVVPTQDTTCFRFLLEKLMLANYHVLYSGETGVGKSVVVQSFLDEKAKTDNCLTSTMSYSAQTKPRNLNEVFELRLDKKRKNVLGTPEGKRMLFFVDDLNMPALEIYGAQPPNELLRQIIDQGGYYDTSKLFYKNVENVVFAAACAPPGGGRTEVNPRLLRHFHMVWISNLSTEVMQRIFSSILGGFFGAELPVMTHLAVPIVDASVELYQQVEVEMLPTPSRSHYTFNLRDLSKVFQGILMVKQENVPTEDDLLTLWLHEETRVFRDRLVDTNDRTWFNVTCSQLLAKKFNVTWPPSRFENLLYGDFMAREIRSYRRIENMRQLNSLLSEYLDDYNITFPSQMHLVFFNDAIHHILRICRVLRQPRGNALLVGIGGSGRQSLTRLASFIADYKCFSIEITRGYGMNEFHGDLKNVLMTAGAYNTPVVLLFSDTQIVNESFLEDINNILNTGEVPNLYANDEIEKIVGLVRPLAQQVGKVSREDVLQYYVTLVRDNLHVVLAFSPIGAGFRNRCRMFPSLVNCCTIDWFNAWPEDALHSVAHRVFSSNADELGIEHHVETLCRTAVMIHRSVEEATLQFYKQLKRQNYTTPTSYLELIRLYVDMLRTHRQLVRAKEARYRGGLQKLTETEEVVGNLQSSLTELQPVLAQAQNDTLLLLNQVAQDQAEADKQQQLIQADVEAANKIAAEVKVIKDDCQKDLDEAMPAYYASIRALSQLKKDDITVLKTFTNPPRLVGVTMNAVCLLFGVKQEWNEAKKLLNDMKFLERLKEFDKDNIPSKTIRQLQKFISDEEFTPETLSSISTAATSLCMWVRAMYTYDTVAKNIEPKKENLKIAEQRLEVEQKQLNVKQNGLNAVLKKVADLKHILEITQQKRVDLEMQSEKTQAQLLRAERLIDSLGEEQGRWKDCAEHLASDMINLVGDIIISVGCIAYLGPFTSEFRHELQAKWVSFCKSSHLPVDENFSFQRVQADPVVVREWNIMGLPADTFSIENGLFTTMGRRWPLMIDPQGQGNKWIKNMYKASGSLQIIKLTQKDFLRTLENAIRYGSPVMLENVEEGLDPSLEPVLLKQTFKRGGQNLLHLGDTDVPYSDNFRFFITTKLANPHYMPEVCVKVTIINFTVTLTGLEDQLLVDVVRNERPDLELKKNELTVKIAADKKQLKEIEDKILHMLENSEGNILDDEELINTLAHSKVTSSAIKTRMSEAETTSLEIDQTREGYRCVAVRGSIIYFVIANLALVDPMYQYSLHFYQKLFVTRLQNTARSEVLEKRLEILMQDITTTMFVNICRGLFEKDKITYAFMIAASILLHRGTISPSEWSFYLVGDKRSSALQGAQMESCGLSRPSWLPDRIWKTVVGMKNISSAFTDLATSVEQQEAEWRRAMSSADPHAEALPEPWESSLANFQKLLVLRVFREEKIVFGTREFVRRELGNIFTESPPFDLAGCYRDSRPETPLIFVLSPGADINDYLLELAKQEGKEGSGLKIISMGQGQGPIAEALMKQAMQAGDWVCLQNCHLAASWLGRLEQILDSMVMDEMHDSFRLWLTSMPSPRFPVPILQNGIKITNEPPRGIKANLGRTFRDIKEADYEACTKPREYKKLLFALAFYNAVCLERRKFGAVGWNIPYEWMNSDLKTGMQQVRLYLEEQEEVPYSTLNVMVADISYGGRITDRWDKRTNSSIMRKLFCKDVMDNSYRFTTSDFYYAPPEGSLASVREYVSSLPTTDAPDIFGLHANADITFQQKETGLLLGTILKMLGGGGDSGDSGGSQSNDSIVIEIVTVIQERMPEPFSKNMAHPVTFAEAADGSRNSLGIFLSQEMIRFNVLTQVINSTLEMLKRAIKGLVVMSGPLEKMYNGFLLQQIPSEWENAGYPCLKPLASWIEDFFMRINLTNNWLVNGPPNAFWLPGFFFPQGFMTAIKQSFSRDRQIAIDALVVSCEIMAHDREHYSAPPPFGVYIFGLFMEGARYDRTTGTIAESVPNELFDRMPVIWLKPMRREEYQPTDVYECPLYKTSIRAGTLSTTGHSTNFVVSLNVPTDKSPDHWIRRGCAMLCMLDT
ncbi:putative bromodomain, AAA+ ATPase domain, dynein heavy chain region D6 P-loop [Plasmopara halstedii]